MNRLSIYILALICVYFMGNGCTMAQDSLKIRTLLNTLASDSLQGRGYVNNGDANAAMFIAQTLANVGAKPLGDTYVQPFVISINTFPGKMAVWLDGKLLKPVDDYVVIASSPSVKGKFKLDYVPEAIDTVPTQFDSLMALPHKGKAVVTSSKKRNILTHGKLNAPLVVVPRKSVYWSVYGADTVVQTPILVVVDSLLNAKPKTIKVNIESQFKANHLTQNILAWVPGTTRTDSVIVFTAHYDHLGAMGAGNIFRGANDNASGCTMLLTLAEYFAQHPAKCPVVFMFFAAEEAGLVGSSYYVANPLFPLSQIKQLVNLDMVGSGSDGIALVNGEANPQMVARVKQLNDSLQLVKSLQVRGTSDNSDHAPFHKAGVPALFIYTKGDEAKAYHNLHDVPETLPLTRFNQLFKLLVEFVN